MSSKYSNFELKYLKYKSKYLTLKKSMKGGSEFHFLVEITLPDDKRKILVIPEGGLLYTHIIDYLKSIKLNISLIKITYNGTELTLANQSKITTTFTREKYDPKSGSSGKPNIKVEYIPVDVSFTLPNNNKEFLKIQKDELLYTRILDYMDLPESLIKITYNGTELNSSNQSNFTAEKYINDSNSNKPEIKVEYIPVNTKKQVDDLITYIYRLNSRATKRIIRATYENDKLYDLVFVKNLYDNSKLILPEGFGYIDMVGSLYLYKNNIESLPNSFGNIKVGKNLSLDYNNLTTLPESFGNIKVGKNLSLEGNKLTTLPESFGNIKVGGNLTLDYNELKTLPESFGYITVGENLFLAYNKLATLPQSFGNIKVGGKLTLDNNNLTTFPESFKNVKGTISLPISMENHFKGDYKPVFN